MDNEYIDISKLKVNYLDENYEEKNDPVYQVQPIINTNKATIMEVGKFKKVPEVLINQFDLSPKERCLILSSIFNKNDLQKISKKCSFSIIRILVNYNSGKKLKPIGCLMLFFHTFAHYKKSICITEYLSSEDNIVKLDGYFSISFHYDEKKIILENSREYCGTPKMIDKMIAYLCYPKIKNIIQNLTKGL